MEATPQWIDGVHYCRCVPHTEGMEEATVKMEYADSLLMCAPTPVYPQGDREMRETESLPLTSSGETASL